MKILIAFYSRSGHTKKVAHLIAKLLKADTDEIIDKTDRSGIRGWLGGGRDAFFKKPTKITISKDPLKYDLVIVGTPIWASTAAPAVRAYLAEHKLKKVAFFSTFGGSEGKAFFDMEAIAGTPMATVSLQDHKIDLKRSEEEIERFCRKISPG